MIVTALIAKPLIPTPQRGSPLIAFPHPCVINQECPCLNHSLSHLDHCLTFGWVSFSGQFLPRWILPLCLDWQRSRWAKYRPSDQDQQWGPAFRANSEQILASVYPRIRRVACIRQIAHIGQSPVDPIRRCLCHELCVYSGNIGHMKGFVNTFMTSADVELP